LANQDPTKPQDSSQFVAQLAQFSALEQQQNTVSRLDSLLIGQATANQTSASSFIGKEVNYRGSTLEWQGTDPVAAGATLSSDAATVSVVVTDASGNQVRTLQLGAHAAGDLSLSWDGRNDTGVAMPSGNYSLQATATDSNGAAVPISLTNSGTVTGVAFQGGVAQLKVGDNLIKMSDVTSINERNTP
jgi:flagellar basal-body rod modification protein FlgD